MTFNATFDAVFWERFHTGELHPERFLVLSIETGAAAILNVLFLALVAATPKKTVQTLMLGGQSTTDAVLAIFNFVFNTRGYQLGHFWSTEHAYCVGDGFFVHLTCGASIFHLMLIAEVRRRAVKSNSHLTVKQYFIAYCVCWLISLVMPLLVLFGVGDFQLLVRLSFFVSFCLSVAFYSVFLSLRLS